MALLIPILQRLAVNRAVAYLLMARIWQFVAGLVTVVLLLKLFTDEFRDFYYLFANLLALQTFVELGLPTILIILASHEWSALGLDGERRITGESRALSRLASLDRFARRWFAAFSLVLLVGVGLAGLSLAQGKEETTLAWQAPWMGAVLVNAASLLYLPRLSILEGCNQVAMINLVRVWQAVTGSLVVWACLAGGAGLWAIMASNTVRWFWECYLVHVYYRRFFTSLATCSRTTPMNWREEIWPLQWRLGLQSITGYFTTYFFVPVLFRYGRPGEAGQMGMTWSILTTLQSTSLAWVQTRMPELGMLAARRDLRTLEQKLKLTGGMAVAVFATGAFTFWLLLVGLRAWGVNAVEGFLPPGTTAMLILGLTAVQMALVSYTYIRIHKKDPAVFLNTFSALLVAGFAWMMGRWYGAMGVAVAYCGVAVLYTLPLSLTLLMIYRRRIHNESVGLQSSAGHSGLRER